MQTAFDITTIITCIFLVVVLISGYYSAFNKNKYIKRKGQKVYMYSALALFILSILRLVFAINLGLNYIFMYWWLVFIWLIDLIISYSVLKEK